MTKRDQCSNCRFRVPDDRDESFPFTCHINPPVLINGTMDDIGVWPMVAEDDWCSKHERKGKTYRITLPIEMWPPEAKAALTKKLKAAGQA